MMIVPYAIRKITIISTLYTLYSVPFGITCEDRSLARHPVCLVKGLVGCETDENGDLKNLPF